MGVQIELKNKLIEKGILPTEMEQTEDVQAQSLSASVWFNFWPTKRVIIIANGSWENEATFWTR